MVYIFLANGFEEMEALATADVLRRSNIATKTVSIENTLSVTSSHSVTVEADCLFGEVNAAEADALVLPGGMPGATNLLAHQGLKQLLADHAQKGKLLAAICAAPMVLGEHGLLAGHKATCYPGFESHLKGATYTAALVESDGNIITGKGPAAAIPFAKEIASRFVSEDNLKQVFAAMLF